MNKQPIVINTEFSQLKSSLNCSSAVPDDNQFKKTRKKRRREDDISPDEFNCSSSVIIYEIDCADFKKPRIN